MAQPDYFDVTSPNQNGGVRAVDIVFLMDNSGSMSDEQAAVEANMRAFVDGLSTSGVDFQLGLLRYGQGARGGEPIMRTAASSRQTLRTSKTRYGREM